MTDESKAGYAAEWWTREARKWLVGDPPAAAPGNTWAVLRTLSLKMPRPIDVSTCGGFMEIIPGGPGIIRFEGECPNTPAIASVLYNWIKSADGKAPRFPFYAPEWMCLYCGTPNSLPETNCGKCGAPRNWLIG